MIEIMSRANPRLKALLAERERLFFFAGDKLVRDLLLRPLRLRLLLLRADAAEEPAAGMATVEEVWRVSPAVMEKASGLKDPPTRLAVLDLPPVEVDFAGLVVGLVDVQDPGNLGTIFRCASAFGVPALALAGGCARPSHPKVVRAAQTALLDVPFQAFPGVDALVARALAAKARVYVTGARPAPSARPLASLELPCLLLFGSEGRGLDPELLERFPLVRLEQKGRIDSLNVAVSACILMHELQRLHAL